MLACITTFVLSRYKQSRQKERLHWLTFPWSVAPDNHSVKAKLTLSTL